MKEHKIRVLGIMSGSSLDGLDVCVAEFVKTRGYWEYEILNTSTIPFEDSLSSRLKTSHTLSQAQLARLDLYFGQWIGERIVVSVKGCELIAIHGHTVKHSPKEGLSIQIGSASEIARLTHIDVVSDFRNLDISLGGEGAPLVPMGEKHLFTEFDSFLNLGGICNATFKQDDDWLAGDIGPFNQVFNYYSGFLGRPFDEGGKFSKSGEVDRHLVEKWRELDFFSESFPKSLGNDWVTENFLTDSNRPQNRLASFAEFISTEISEVINEHSQGAVMVTGGGAYNDFLIELIRLKTKTNLVVPHSEIIEYKEALIFGFLGLLRYRDEINVMSSCTGASEDSCSGTIHFAGQNQ